MPPWRWWALPSASHHRCHPSSLSLCLSPGYHCVTGMEGSPSGLPWCQGTACSGPLQSVILPRGFLFYVLTIFTHGSKSCSWCSDTCSKAQTMFPQKPPDSSWNQKGNLSGIWLPALCLCVMDCSFWPPLKNFLNCVLFYYDWLHPYYTHCILPMENKPFVSFFFCSSLFFSALSGGQVEASSLSPRKF